MANGTIYLENHNRGGTKGTKFKIWCAEIFINGKKFRKRSMDRGECEFWLYNITH